VRLTARAERDLDLLRGIAALLVFVSHLRAVFLTDVREAGLFGVVPRALYAATSLGHIGVLLFFVLSGYLVARSFRRAPPARRFRHYTIARASRILTVYWPALLLGLVLDRVGLQMFGAVGLYGSHPAENLAAGDVLARLTPTVFLGNAAFLQTLRVPVLGTNVPLWSMAYEAWFYVAFPLLVVVLQRRRASILAALVLAGLFLLLRGYLAEYFAMWLVGASLTLLPAGFALGARSRALAIAAVLLAIAARRAIAVELLGDAVVTVFFAFLVATRISPRNDAPPARIPTVAARALARLSFSLYLTHVPALSFAAALLAVPPRWAPSGSSLLALALVAAAVIGYATIVWCAIERHTPRVRQFFERLG